MKRKVLSMLLCLAMIFTSAITMAVPVYAEGTASTPEVWAEDTADTTWYTNAQGGTKVYTIKTAEELAGLAKLVNSGTSFRGKTVELGANINLGGVHWTPIGYSSTRPFMGEFDGNGYTISNLYINEEYYEYSRTSGNVTYYYYTQNETKRVELPNPKCGLFGQIGLGGNNDSTRYGAYLHDFTVYNTTIKNVKLGTGVIVGSAFHDNVLENITVDTATLSGNSPSSAIAGGIQSSQLRNIVAKNIEINANNGGEIGGLFGCVQGQTPGSKIKYHAPKADKQIEHYYLPGTVLQDTDDDDTNNNVIVTYMDNVDGENITINVKNANSYIGGFVAYAFDGLSGDRELFQNCDIKGLTINILSTSGTPVAGGFAGLRSGVANYTFTNTGGEQITLGGYDGCSASGVINGKSGTYGGFIGESRAYNCREVANVTYSNVTTDMKLIVNSGATAGGFIGYVNTAKDNKTQDFKTCTVLGTTQIGTDDPVSSTFIGKLNAPVAGAALSGCNVPALENIDKLWAEASNADPSLNETEWKRAKQAEILIGTITGNSLSPVITSVITFDTNTNDTIAPILQAVGTPVTAPTTVLTKTGHTFDGWDKEIPTTMPAASIKINVKWKVNQYTITLLDADGVSVIGTITQDYGTAITAPTAPTKTGYTFAGWDKQIPTTMPAEDMVIKANWRIQQYTITFDTDGGSAIAPITQNYGTTITAPANPTKEGYVFAGWNEPIPETMPAGGLTLTALWRKSITHYTVCFKAENRWFIIRYREGADELTVIPKVPEKEGYIGTWEEYELTDKNILVHAVYTPK